MLEKSDTFVAPIANRLLLQKNKDGQTFLHLAAENGTERNVQSFLHLPNTKVLTEILLAQSNDGATVFHYAARNTDDEVLKTLLEYTGSLVKSGRKCFVLFVLHALLLPFTASSISVVADLAILTLLVTNIIMT